MIPRKPRVFLDTSVVFAAVLSPAGGSRALFMLGEAGLLTLVVGPTVVRECDDVIHRKMPTALPLLAQLLAAAYTESSAAATRQQLEAAVSYVRYAPDAHVLAEAMQARPDWFVTHDKQHFLRSRSRIGLPFKIGTPGDLLQEIKGNLTVH